jgi:alpha-galactosidase
MADIGRRLARENGVTASVTPHTDRAEALDGADFVVCAAAVQGLARWRRDCEIVDSICPGHAVTEFGGVAGISYSLRQIALILGLTDDMRRLCPKARLLDVSNPLPRVCQAAQANGVETVGFCSVSLNAYCRLWRLLVAQDEGLPYPFTPARERWRLAWAGLNHFTWLVEAVEQTTGRDILGEARRLLAEGGSTGEPVCDRIAHETGWMLLPHDGHTRDFLPPQPGATASRHSPFHGSPEARAEDERRLCEVAEGRLPCSALSVGRPVAWERPMDLVAAVALGRATEFEALNLPNHGQVPNLPAGVFVETPCAVSTAGTAPRVVPLPPPALPLSLRTAAVTDAIARAALGRSRRLLREAVDLDPTIGDKTRGFQAVTACLEAHADLLPEYT